MNKYKEAVLLKLTFRSTSGIISILDVNDLSKETLNTMALTIFESLPKNAMTFLEDAEKIDAKQELRLAILKDLINCKQKAESHAIEQDKLRQELAEFSHILLDKQLKDKKKKSTKDVQAAIAAIQAKIDQ